MIKSASGGQPAALVERLAEFQDAYRLAVRRDDVAAANRRIEKVWSTVDMLASTPEGRAMLETLLASPVAYLRLRAAEGVLKWAPDKAIPVLGRLLIDDLGQDSSAAERIDIRISAKDWLFKLCAIRTSDRNDLIEPLKAHGVEIPWRSHDVWT